MARFFITTNMRNGDKQFQVHFETDAAEDVYQLHDVLRREGSVVGLRFKSKDPSIAPEPMILSAQMVGLAQLSTY